MKKDPYYLYKGLFLLIYRWYSEKFDVWIFMRFLIEINLQDIKNYIKKTKYFTIKIIYIII